MEVSNVLRDEDTFPQDRNRRDAQQVEPDQCLVPWQTLVALVPDAEA